jgi:hypothetical protein
VNRLGHAGHAKGLVLSTVEVSILQNSYRRRTAAAAAISLSTSVICKPRNDIAPVEDEELGNVATITLSSTRSHGDGVGDC